MVDLLALAVHLTEAYNNFVERMPIKLEAKLLTALFSSCCSRMNVELAKTVGQRLIELEPEEQEPICCCPTSMELLGTWKM